MRLSTILSFSLFVLPFAFSQATWTSTTAAVATTSTPASVVSDKKGGGGSQCSNDPTRDHNTCKCFTGFVDPGNSRKECKCGDSKNAELEYHSDKAVCVCSGSHQLYNTKTEKCECKTEYEASYNKNGKLKCKRDHTSTVHSSSTSSSHSSSTSSSTTSIPSGYYKRSEQLQLNEALKKRDELPGTVEEVLRCKAGEKACKTGSVWHCTDILSSLSTCGGCPGEAIDCASLPGASEVRCEKGRCVIDSCRRSYYHKESTDIDAPSNTTCIAKHGEHWLVAQAAQGRMRRRIE